MIKSKKEHREGQEQGFCGGRFQYDVVIQK